jgi:hypothetical protein
MENTHKFAIIDTKILIKISTVPLIGGNNDEFDWLINQSFFRKIHNHINGTQSVDSVISLRLSSAR